MSTPTELLGYTVLHNCIIGISKLGGRDKCLPKGFRPLEVCCYHSIWNTENPSGPCNESIFFSQLFFTFSPLVLAIIFFNEDSRIKENLSEKLHYQFDEMQACLRVLNLSLESKHYKVMMAF